MRQGSREAGMAMLIPVMYGRLRYPFPITTPLKETAAHFDRPGIDPGPCYVLHTEYAYGRRQLTSCLLADLDVLRRSHADFVPQLWYSAEWAEQFAEFILRITHPFGPPRVIEVHPPFRDYCPTVSTLLERYSHFEHYVKREYPNVEILMENRHGSLYSGAAFLVSTADDIVELAEQAKGTSRRVTLDIPQLLSSHGATNHIDSGRIDDIILSLMHHREWIRGIHIWGTRSTANRARVAHMGDLETYFQGDPGQKQRLLSVLRQLLGDGRPRFFVPEVNDSERYFLSIVADLIRAGFHFVDCTAPDSHG